MGEMTYSVSEAVRLVGVESHVLRYWEEELGIPIQRTSLGHRVYSQKDIEVFCQVREWKQKGLQLKAIRLLLDKSAAGEEARTFEKQIWRIAYADFGDEEPAGDDGKTGGEEPAGDDGKIGNTETAGGSREVRNGEEKKTGEIVYEIVPAQESMGNLEKVVLILKQMMEEVVAEQNKKLEREITEQLREELESLYLQYIQALQEASAEREQEHRQAGMLRKLIRKWFPEGK